MWIFDALDDEDVDRTLRHEPSEAPSVPEGAEHRVLGGQRVDFGAKGDVCLGEVLVRQLEESGHAGFIHDRLPCGITAHVEKNREGARPLGGYRFRQRTEEQSGTDKGEARAQWHHG